MDIGAGLGASNEASSQRLCLYIPNKDRDDHSIPGHDRWVEEARTILTRIGGGSTALPLADGTWEQEGGGILWEQTRFIYCFVVAERFEENLASLRDFLHRFGREANQGEVVVEFDGRFYRIKDYDEPKTQ